jgi:hypothetical protein
MNSTFPVISIRVMEKRAPFLAQAARLVTSQVVLFE